jgi:hypothetical protein
MRITSDAPTAQEEIATIAAANNWAEQPTAAWTAFTRDQWRLVVHWAVNGNITRATLGDQHQDLDGEVWWDMNTKVTAPGRRQKVVDILQEPRTGERK